MKIAPKSIAWTDPNAGQGVANFFLYYSQESIFSYDLPNVSIPAVQGQTEYTYLISGNLPLTEGNWTLWVAPADSEGNIADPVSVTRFFDLTPPLPITNLRVL